MTKGMNYEGCRPLLAPFMFPVPLWHTSTVDGRHGRDRSFGKLFLTEQGVVIL